MQVLLTFILFLQQKMPQGFLCYAVMIKHAQHWHCSCLHIPYGGPLSLQHPTPGLHNSMCMFVVCEKQSKGRGKSAHPPKKKRQHSLTLTFYHRVAVVIIICRSDTVQMMSILGDKFLYLEVVGWVGGLWQCHISKCELGQFLKTIIYDCLDVVCWCHDHNGCLP